MNQRILQAIAVLLACLGAHAQVNSGSNGSDGAFHPTQNTVINMADHPDGIYHYTSVNISNGVTVTFIPNANNTPVVWLVQSNVVMNGTVDVSGLGGNGGQSGRGGPGGWSGGGGVNGGVGESGQGPGGGVSAAGYLGGNASYGRLGTGPGSNVWGAVLAPGPTYGNSFLIPLLGGSGGGASGAYAGGGGGGAILIVANNTLTINGTLKANGGQGTQGSPGCIYEYGAGGSGGAIRCVAARISGTGFVQVYGWSRCYWQSGAGRVRFDTYQNEFGGSVSDVFSVGSQFIIIPFAGQLPELVVTSVGGVPVSASPSGQLATPDAVLSAQQSNPISIIMHCSNIPLNTQITVSVKPANGAAVSATGLNSSGTLSSSTATVLLNMPRGGGLIFATAATGN